MIDIFIEYTTCIQDTGSDCSLEAINKSYVELNKSDENITLEEWHQ